MNYHFKAALLGGLALIAAGASHAALETVAEALSRGEYRAALSALEEVPEAQRRRLSWQLLHARALAGNGDLEAAESSYLALIRQAPKQLEAYNNLAVLYAAQGRLDEARQLLERAMRTHPGYATVYDNLSDVYLAMSRSAYAKALQIGERQEGTRLQPLYAVLDDTAPPKETMVVAQAGESVSVAQADAEEAVAEETVAEETVAEETVAEETVAEETVAEETVAEETVAEETVAEETVAEETVAEETVAEETVAEETVAEEAVAEETVAEETVAEEAVGDVMLVEEAVAEEQEVVIAALRQWAAAWSGQDVDAYLAAYAETFRPGRGLSLEQWRAQRRQRLQSPAFIEVKLSDFDVSIRDGKVARVDVIQHYRSDRYSDRTRKRMRLIRQPGGWKIVSEKTIEVL